MDDEVQVRVVVVGAGLAGVAAAVRLRQAGIEDFVVLEKSDRVGGTWRDNTYPGCGCDIPSVVYSFSFAPNPDWGRAFALQPDILTYIEKTVAEFGVEPWVRLNTEVTEAAWSTERLRWLVQTPGTRYVAQFVIFAAGPITEPSIPAIPGIDDFEGEVFHSARWNHELDLTGKRVAVIGTGASAVQFVPEIQPSVDRLYLFQRTASWVVPRLDAPIPRPLQSVFRRFPQAQGGLRALLDRVLRALSFAVRHERIARALNPIGRLHLRWQVTDPALRRALTPDFTLGCKRLMLSNDYYPALTRPNVEVIPRALSSVDGNEVVGADGTRREVDVIIFGTGFDVSHPPIAHRIRGTDGRLLAEHWAHSPEAYLGTTVPGIPNGFVLLGPNLLVYNSFLGLAESQLDYVTDAIRRTAREGIEVVDVRPEVVRRFNDDVQDGLRQTVFNTGGCSSYYLDDQGRNFAAWPWSTTDLRKRLSRFDLENYHVVSRRPPNSPGSAGAYGASKPPVG
ncbi:MAG: flavin-containing monooxygenase [Pseudonocardiaceae bacterium]